jgi:GntR family transcriptional regulator
MKEDERKHRHEKPQMLKDLGFGFALDTRSGVPFYRQIIQMVEYNVATGELKPGDRLPTIRALSIALKVNPNTIAKAYMELEIRGIVQTQVGSGTYISDKKINTDEEKDKLRKKVEALCIELIRKAGALGAGRDDLIKIIREIQIGEEGVTYVREEE